MAEVGRSSVRCQLSSVSERASYSPVLTILGWWELPDICGIRGWLQTALIKTLIKRNLEKYLNSALGCSQNVVIASHDSD